MEDTTAAEPGDRHDAGPAPGVAAPRLSVSTGHTLELLRARSAPVDLAALSRRADLHPNTVREHLTTLIEAGLVQRTRARTAGRGRPAWLYEARAALPLSFDYAGLAIALAGVVHRTSPDPTTDAELAGERWGRDLARQRGAEPTTPEAARDHAVDLLDDLGFAPRRDEAGGPTIRLTRCPLLDAARANPRVVCSVHLGMLRGVLAEDGADPTGSHLVPFAEPGSCLLVVPPLPPRQP